MAVTAPQCLVTDGVNWESIEPMGRCRTYGGNGAFVTSGASVVVYIPKDVVYILENVITPVCYNATATTAGSSASSVANGAFTLGGVYLDTNGLMRPSTAGQVTVYRAAGTDSGALFSFSIKWR